MHACTNVVDSIATAKTTHWSSVATCGGSYGLSLGIVLNRYQAQWPDHNPVLFNKVASARCCSRSKLFVDRPTKYGL